MNLSIVETWILAVFISFALICLVPPPGLRVKEQGRSWKAALKIFTSDLKFSGKIK